MRWRTQPEIRSTTIVTAITTASAAPATPHCLKKKPWYNSAPMPPAPSTPSTADTRMLISKR